MRQTTDLAWQSEAALAGWGLAPALLNWLTERGSLTQRLRKQHGSVAVHVLFEGVQPAPIEASGALANHRPMWERCVQLVAGARTRIAARTCIAQWGPDNPWREMQHLGNRPLGELLFELDGLERSALTFARIGGDATAPLARRCVYRRGGSPLELTEVFLDVS